MNNMTQNGADRMNSFDTVILAHITPLLPGANMSGPYLDMRPSSIPVCYDTAHQLKIFCTANSNKYYTLTRALPFFERERACIEEIIRSIHQVIDQGEIFSSKLVSRSVSLAVARQVAPGSPETLSRLIQVYEKWSDNAPTTHTSGLRLMKRRKAAENFFRLEKQDLLRAFGSSSDTMIVMDVEGDILGVEKNASLATDTKNNQEILAPVTVAGLAGWANSPRKVAVRLSEDGTILVFSKKCLLFAQRGQYWHSLPHTLANLEKASESLEDIAPEAMKAIYLTALDMAAGYATTYNWLIRIERQNQSGKATDKKRRAANAKLIFSMTKEKKFQDITRTIRAEICAMGGVLLLDNDGGILGFEPARPKENNRGVDELTLSRDGVFRGKQYMEILNSGLHPGMHLDIR